MCTSALLHAKFPTCTDVHVKWFCMYNILCMKNIIYEGLQPCMDYCFHVWAGAPNCYLELLDKLQKQICRTIGLSLAVSLEYLLHHRNVASVSLFYGYYSNRFSSELAQLVPLPYS